MVNRITKKATLYLWDKDGVLRKVSEVSVTQCQHSVADAPVEIPGLRDFTITIKQLPTHNLVMPPAESDPELN